MAVDLFISGYTTLGMIDCRQAFLKVSFTVSMSRSEMGASFKRPSAIWLSIILSTRAPIASGVNVFRLLDAASTESAIMSMAVSLVRGFGPGYWKFALSITLSGFSLTAVFVEIFGDSLAMMLGDERPDHHRKLLLGGYGQSVGHVGDNLVGACLRVQSGVGIDSVLVFGEENRALHLSYVVVEGSSPDQGGVGPDSSGRLGSKGGDLHGMLKRAGGLPRRAAGATGC